MNGGKAFVSGLGGPTNFLISKKFANELTGRVDCQILIFEGYTSIQVDTEINMVVGMTKEWQEKNMKSETVADIYADKVRISQTFSKKITKKIEPFAALVNS